MSTLKIIYAGTPEFAVPALQALIDSPHEVVAVYVRPEKTNMRGNKTKPDAVEKFAIEKEIPVEKPASFKDEETLQKLISYNADLIVVAAYGEILPQAVLDIPKYGCLNIHASLLPRWRGAAPINRAIQAGDTETGVTIMQMDAGLDTGDMLYKTRCPITDNDTAQNISERLASDGAKALMTVLEQLMDDKLEPEAQDDSLSSYAHKLDKAEQEIDWTQSAIQIDRMIRGFNNHKPYAFTYFNGQPLKFFNSKVATDKTTDAPPGTVVEETREGIYIATGDGVVSISRLQISGGKAMDVRAFLNGKSLAGAKLPS